MTCGQASFFSTPCLVIHTSSVPGTVLGTRDTAENKQGPLHSLSPALTWCCPLWLVVRVSKPFSLTHSFVIPAPPEQLTDSRCSFCLIRLTRDILSLPTIHGPQIIHSRAQAPVAPSLKYYTQQNLLPVLILLKPPSLQYSRASALAGVGDHHL